MWQPFTLFRPAVSTEFALTIDILCKVTVVLVMATVAARLLGRSSAANRHFVWTLAITGTLLIPFGVLLLPGWGPSEGISSHRDQPSPHVVEPARTARDKHTTALVETVDAIPPSALVSLQIPNTPEVDQTAIYGSGRIAWSVWLLISSVLLTRVAAAWVGSYRLQSTSPKIADPNWYRLLAESVSVLNIRRKVALRRTARWVAPVTSGVLRPFIILPAECERWDVEQRRSSLVHELAHIKRLDVLTLFLTNVACAFFWFHPLVWYARRRMKIERERACDDAVINAGVKPSTYSDHLLKLSTNWSHSNSIPQGAVAMANPQHLTDRVHRILSSQCSRQSLSTVSRTLIAAVMVFSFAALATAGKVAVRDSAGNVIATLEIPDGGSVTVEPDDVRTRALDRLKALNQRRMHQNVNDPEVLNRIRQYEEAFEIQSNIADALKKGRANAKPAKELASGQFEWRRNTGKTVSASVVGIEVQRKVDGIRQERPMLLSGLLLDDRRIVTWAGPTTTPSRWKVRLADHTTPVTADLASHDAKSGVAMLRLRDSTAAASVSFGVPAQLKSGADVRLMSRQVDGSIRSEECAVASVSRRVNVNSTWALDNLIQLDKAVHPGGSGGPVLNDNGQVVGLAISIREGSKQGIGFVLPINIALNAVNGFELSRLNDVDSDETTVNSKVSAVKDSPVWQIDLSGADQQLIQQGGIFATDFDNDGAIDFFLPNDSNVGWRFNFGAAPGVETNQRKNNTVGTGQDSDADDTDPEISSSTPETGWTMLGSFGELTLINPTGGGEVTFPHEILPEMDRQRLARGVYELLIREVGTAAENKPRIDNAAARRLAQWAVNMVDRLDADSESTTFHFDDDLSDGWQLDGSSPSVNGIEDVTKP